MNVPHFTSDLFDGSDVLAATEVMADGAVILRGLLRKREESLLRDLELVLATAALRHMSTPGGHRMSVAMSNCGQVGWVTDRGGYRYAATDPETGAAWPALPATFLDLAAHAAAIAGFAAFVPDSCLINCYQPGARMSLHQDRNEKDFSRPIVSVSLGLPAVFLFGGMRRNERPRRYRLAHGDVAVWGGAARLAFHGIAPLAAGRHARLGGQRFNLTFRKAL